MNKLIEVGLNGSSEAMSVYLNPNYIVSVEVLEGKTPNLYLYVITLSDGRVFETSSTLNDEFNQFLGISL